MRRILLAAALVFLSATGCTQQSVGPVTAGPIKEWRFPARQGEVVVRVDHGQGQELVLGLMGLTCTGCLSMDEAKKALRAAIAEMPRSGLDPHRLTRLIAGLDETEVRDKVAVAALQSRQWTMCMSSPGCGGNQGLVHLLQETGAFTPFDEVFQPYGLTVRVASAEKVSVARASKVPGLVLPAGTNGSMRVPVGATLEIALIVNGAH